MTVDATDIRETIETDLGDEAIARLIADATSAIEDRTGASGSQTVTLKGGDQYIFLPQPVASAGDIASISERWLLTEFALTTDEWRLVAPRQVERLIGAANISPTIWGWNLGWDGGNGWDRQIDVVVTYTPAADTDRRDRVTIDLVRLALQYNALSSERAGDYASSSVGNYQLERERLISELVAPMSFA